MLHLALQNTLPCKLSKGFRLIVDDTYIPLLCLLQFFHERDPK